MHYPATKKFRLKVIEADTHYRQKRDALPSLPPLTHGVRTLINLCCPPSTYRIVCFLWENNGARTDQIAASVSINNVSDSASRPAAKDSLDALGLAIRCEVYPNINRFDQAGTIGRWWLTIEDHTRLFREDAANDSVA